MKQQFFKSITTVCLVLGVLMMMTGCQKQVAEAADPQVDATEVQTEEAGETVEGTEISVLLPPWYNFSQDMLDDFENETGVKVNLEIMDWDPMQDKIFTAVAAGQAPADITEFSWDWVGKFGKAGWYTPLNEGLGEDFFSDITTKNIYKYEDQYLAVPIYNDFRVSYANTADFEAADVVLPQTPEALLDAARVIKSKGIEDYPIALPLSATAGTTTPWFLLTKTYGGELFDNDWNPTFTEPTSAGYKAMEWIATAAKEELVNPAAISFQGTDIVELFKKGEGSFDIAGWAGNVTSYKNPEESDIAETVQVVKVPFVGKSRTYGLHEAIGIPSASEHKEAAMLFIEYLNRPEVLEALFYDMGIFPNHQTTIDKAIDAGKLPAVFSEVMPTIEPLFPQGAPEWYVQFESEAASTINQIAKGNITVDEGMKALGEFCIDLEKNAQ